MGAMARSDLMDRLEAVLPRVDPADEARQILGVMARICRAASAAVFFERGGVLRWLAGDRLSDDVATAIERAWRSQRQPGPDRDRVHGAGRTGGRSPGPLAADVDAPARGRRARRGLLRRPRSTAARRLLRAG